MVPRRFLGLKASLPDSSNQFDCLVASFVDSICAVRSAVCFGGPRSALGSLVVLSELAVTTAVFR